MVEIRLDPFSRREEPVVDNTIVSPKNTDISIGDVEASFELPKDIEDKTKKPLSPDAKALQTQKNLALASAGVGILNAQFEFSQIESRGKTNIMLANTQFNQSLSIGRQQAAKAETAGFARGEQKVLAAVAQGQEAGGGIAQSAQLAEEIIGVLNAAQIETNAIREAYGFKQEAALTQHEINLAEINRNAQIATSALSGAIAFI